MANRRPVVLSGANLPQQFDGSADTLDVNGPMSVTGAAIIDGASASLEVPNAAGGRTVDAAGEVTVDTTSETFNFYDGTVEKVLDPQVSKSVSIEDPTSSEDITLWYAESAITLQKLTFVLLGSSTPSVTVEIRFDSDRNATGTLSDSNVITNTTTGTDVTAFTDATIPADNFVWLETTAQSGTVDLLHVTLMYTIDA